MRLTRNFVAVTIYTHVQRGMKLADAMRSAVRVYAKTP